MPNALMLGAHTERSESSVFRYRYLWKELDTDTMFEENANLR